MGAQQMTFQQNFLSQFQHALDLQTAIYFANDLLHKFVD
jgi:hypothetical protein